MIGGVLFLVGLVGLVAASTFFAWEAKQGTRVFSGMRVRCDRAVAVTYRKLVFGEISHEYRTSTIATLRKLSQKIIHSLVLGVRLVEKRLTRMSHSLTYSQRVQAKADGERVPSPFLKDMTPVKKDGKKPENPV